MPGLNPPASTQYFASQGEATPAEKLPEKYISNPAATSPISGRLRPPVEAANNHLNAPVVNRKPLLTGMRYLYAGGHIHIPIKRLGADGPPSPWTSAYQPDLHGPIHNAGFNDGLYQAGYPGWNLGLSFRVPTLPQNNTVPTRGVQKMYNISQKLIRTKRATGRPDKA